MHLRSAPTVPRLLGTLVAAMYLVLVAASCSGGDGVSTAAASRVTPDTAVTAAPVTPEAVATATPVMDWIPVVPISPTPTPPPDVPATPTPVAPDPTVTLPPGARIINVYWLGGEGAVTGSPLVAGGRVVASDGVALAAMQALLAGPNELEKSLGMGSAIPDGTEVLGLTIADGVATIDLSREFNDVGTGTSGEMYLLSQVIYTLTQFPGVESVTFIFEGEEVEFMMGHGRNPRGHTRSIDVFPGVLIESPYPGQTVPSPIVISGQRRTFESTVLFEVTNAAGDVIGFGFTTASELDVDQDGPFSFTVELTRARPARPR